MVDHICKFDGIVYDSSVTDSVPPALLQFVCMIEHEVDIKSRLKFGATRYSKDHETPFPVYIGMSVYADQKEPPDQKTKRLFFLELNGLYFHNLTCFSLFLMQN